MGIDRDLMRAIDRRMLSVEVRGNHIVRNRNGAAIDFITCFYVVALRWSPETGQVGSLSPNQKYDPVNVHETTSA